MLQIWSIYKCFKSKKYRTRYIKKLILKNLNLKDFSALWSIYKCFENIEDSGVFHLLRHQILTYFVYPPLSRSLGGIFQRSHPYPWPSDVTSIRVSEKNEFLKYSKSHQLCGIISCQSVITSTCIYTFWKRKNKADKWHRNDKTSKNEAFFLFCYFKNVCFVMVISC